MSSKPIFLDFSHSITSFGTATFTRTDTMPVATFQEGDSHGFFFITSTLHNLASNLATHIDLPGHLYPEIPNPAEVGSIPLDRFCGNATILDCRHLMKRMDVFFDDSGKCKIDKRDSSSWRQLIDALDSLELNLSTVMKAVQMVDPSGSATGIIFACGNSKYYSPGKRAAEESRYFFNPYLSEEAARWLISRGTKFVGIDSFQLEDPIINFRGDEHFFVLAPDLRNYLSQKLLQKKKYSNHTMLLGEGIPIFENLNIPDIAIGKSGLFFGQPLNLRIEGVNDNALCRPVFIAGGSLNG